MLIHDDPVFFKDRDDIPWTNDAGNVEVRCMGEMRADYHGRRISNGQQLIAAGITTEVVLRDLEEAGKIEWTFNPWFEVGVLEGTEWAYNSPAFSSLKDAIAHAHTVNADP